MRDVHSRARVGQGRIRHISFKLRPNFERTNVHFHAHYEMDRPVRRHLNLDVQNIQIDRAQTSGTPLAFQIDQDDPMLGQQLILLDLEGAREFDLEGTCSPQASALQWMEPKMTAGGLQPFLYTQCQAIHARSVFPCQDTPSVRFTFDAEIEVPDSLRAVMGAAFVGERRRKSSRVFRYQMSQPVPSYLFSMAVGDLVFRQTSDRCGVYAETPLADAAAWEFGRADEMLRFAESEFGPYRWDRYDVLVLPKGFPFGGMENPRLTFLSPAVIIGDRSHEATLAHELGHAWTGNLVTNATWESFWLNEGWTTYIECRILEAFRGEEVAAFRWRASLDQLETELGRLRAHPEWTALRYSMEGLDPDETLSLVPYVKGALFLRAIEKWVGRTQFDQFIRRYIRHFAFKSITTETFLSYLERRLPGLEDHLDLNSWVDEPGMPPHPPKVTSKWYEQVDEARVHLGQGLMPRKAEVSGWDWRQVAMFLNTIPKEISLETCRALDDAFELRECNQPTALSHFYERAIRAGYKKVLPRVRSYLEEIGVMFNLRPVYQALAETPWSRPLVASIYGENRPGYHPTTRRIIEGILHEQGIDMR